MPLLGSKHNDEVVDPNVNNSTVGNTGVTGTGTTTDPNVGHGHLGHNTHNTTSTGLTGNNQNTTGFAGNNQNTTGFTGNNQNTGTGFTGHNQDNLATGTSTSANTGTGAPLAGGQTTDTTGHHHHHQHNVGTGVGAGAAAAGTGAGFNAADPATHESHGNPLYPSPHAPGAAQVNEGTTGTGHHTGTGVGTGTGAGTTHSSQVKTASGKSASTQAIIGKIEQVVGTVLHSTSMKEKGLAKEQEAEAAKMQQAELAHAEGLEGQANLARDRANVHSAHGAAHASGATGTDVNYAAGPTQVGQGFQQPALGIQGAGGAGSARAI